MTMFFSLWGRRIAAFLERHLWLIVIPAVVLLAYVIVDYSPLIIRWDDAYFIRNTLCVRDAVYGGGGKALGGCLSHIWKSPIMAFLGIPWGMASTPDIIVQTSFVALSVATFAVAIACFIILLRIGVNLFMLLLALLFLALNEYLREQRGVYLADGMFSFIVTLALLLIPLELKSPALGKANSVMRGCLWGAVITLGVLSKITFGFFIALIAPVLLYQRWKNAGRQSTCVTLVASFVVMLPALAIYALFGKIYFSYGVQCSFGSVAKLYTVDGMGAKEYVLQYIHYISFHHALRILALLSLAALWAYTRKPRPSWLFLYPLLILLGYLGIAATSSNRDFRFAMPLMIALPLLLAAITANMPRYGKRLTVPALVALLLGVLISAPMMMRPDMHMVQKARMILTQLTDKDNRPVSVLMATDVADFNSETLQLARQMETPKLQSIEIGMLGYDDVSGKTLAQSLARIDAADYILFKTNPKDSPDWANPSWSNRFVPEFREHCAKVGKKIDADPADEVEVYHILRSKPR